MKITLEYPDTVKLTYMMKRKDGWFVSVKCPDDDLDPDGISLGLVTGSHTYPNLQVAIDCAVYNCLNERKKVIESRAAKPISRLDEFLEDLALDVFIASKS